MLSNLKTAINGTYLAVKFTKYGHRYFAEVEYRFNPCFHLAAMLPLLMRAVGKSVAITRVVIRSEDLAC